MCLGSHRANSNLREDEFASKIGLVNVYCRPDCQRLDPPDGHKGKKEDELLAHAAEVQRRVAEGGMEGGRDRGTARSMHGAGQAGTGRDRPGQARDRPGTGPGQARDIPRTCPGHAAHGQAACKVYGGP